jgi:hypothetical protein
VKYAMLVCAPLAAACLLSGCGGGGGEHAAAASEMADTFEDYADLLESLKTPEDVKRRADDIKAMAKRMQAQRNAPKPTGEPWR